MEDKAEKEPQTQLAGMKDGSKDMEANPSTAEPKVWKNSSFCERIGIIRRYITVEPMLACYIMPSVIASIAVQNLNLEKACRVNQNYSTELCDDIITQRLNGSIEEVEVQKLVAYMGAWRLPLQTALPAIMILFIGPWSDRTGKRKPCMLFPILGEFLTAVGLIFCTYYFLQWPLEVAGVIEALPPALTGGYATMFLGIFTYLADNTTPEERTFRIGVVNTFISLALPVGMALSGTLLNAIGFYGVFTISIAFYGAAFLYGYFGIHDKKVVKEVDTNHQKELTSCTQFFSLVHVWDTFMVIFKKRATNRRLQTILLVVCYILVSGPVHGTSSAAKKDRVPPVVMTLGNLTHAQITTAVQGHIGHPNFTFRYNRGGTANIFVRSMADHRALTNGLRAEARGFHTYTAEAEKLKKAVIKGLPNVETEDIAADLTEQGFPPVKVVKMTTASAEYPMYLATFDKEINMGQLRAAVKYLCHCRIRLQKHRSNHLQHGTQCYRCQNFGHGSRNCAHTARCVKCLVEHASAECPKTTRDEPAACCNCGGPHPANFRGCPKRVAYVASLQQHQRHPQRQAPGASRPPPHTQQMPRTDGRSWANVAGGRSEERHEEQPRSQPRTQPRTQQPAGEARSDAQLMMALLEGLDRLRPELAAASSEAARAWILMGLITSTIDV